MFGAYFFRAFYFRGAYFAAAGAVSADTQVHCLPFFATMGQLKSF